MEPSLETSLNAILHLTSKQKTALKKAGIETARDILYYFPARYEDFSSQKRIADLAAGERASITGTIEKICTKRMFRRRIPLVESQIKDASGTIKAIWFSQPYVAKTLPQGTTVRLSGKVNENKKGLYLVNPVYEITEKISEKALDMSSSKTPIPIYPQVRGLSSRWFQIAVQKVLPLSRDIKDIIPEHIIRRYHLPPLAQALTHIHRPKTALWAEASRKRFAFEEIFLIQLNRMKLKKELEKEPAYAIPYEKNLLEEFVQTLSFSLTKAQSRAIMHIIGDFSRGQPMARLLEGDVGSGKTLVAVAVSLLATNAGFQTAYMAPTEILARQHFDEFCLRLKPFRNKIGLITSSECKIFPSKVNPKEATHISRAQLLKWISDGSVQILIGTHALVQNRVKFKKLALAIVDEQHRFGIRQRARLAKQKTLPHFLSMTATPIPRTLALTLYGDLDLSLLDEMPPGRKKPVTYIVPPEKRDGAYDFIRNNIKEGGQAFVICPKIEERATPSSSSGQAKFSDTKAVKTEYEKLKRDVFPELSLAMLHGKLKPKEKEDIIKKFRERKIAILVSTSVIEVGMDIPNASIMMIEGAERFGLASLHQFRGRVGRAGQEAYCFVFTESRSPKTLARLEALTKTKNGFELAEYDLALRGPGELSGVSQWGISDLGMEALKNIKMVEASRESARELLEEDLELKKYPLLKERVESSQQHLLHFE